MAKKMISLEIPEDLKKDLRVEAFKQNLTISALIRKVLTEHIPRADWPTKNKGENN